MKPTPDRVTVHGNSASGARRHDAVLTVAALRALERSHAMLPLMERAGQAAAQQVLARLDRSHASVIVLAGPGNNGGDACVVARILHQHGLAIEVLGRPATGRSSADTEAAWKAMRAAGVREIQAPPSRPPTLIVDGLFGIGLARPIGAPGAEWIVWANHTGAPILALDIPSGLDAATGVAHEPAIRAEHTATFIALKPGLLTGDGPDHCGTISVHDLGLDDVDATRSGRWLTWPLPGADLPEILARPRRATHKGSFGTVVVAGGAEGMVGAALLAGRSALALGAGRVVVEQIAHGAPRVDPVAPELMLNEASIRPSRAPAPAGGRPVLAGDPPAPAGGRPPAELRDDWPAIDAQALVVGPGFGQGELARALLVAAIAYDAPLVLDADALNLIAQDARLREAVAARSPVTVLTPHPAEAARLLACDTAAVQADRIAAASELASRFCATVILKGAGTIIAHPQGGVGTQVPGGFDINATGNPALSTAGSGDVLAGMLGALLAQRIDAATAARIAVCVHGAAADALVAEGIGPVGVRASEVIEKARALVNAATHDARNPGRTPF